VLQGAARNYEGVGPHPERPAGLTKLTTVAGGAKRDAPEQDRIEQPADEGLRYCRVARLERTATVGSAACGRHHGEAEKGAEEKTRATHGGDLRFGLCVVQGVSVSGRHEEATGVPIFRRLYKYSTIVQ